MEQLQGNRRIASRPTRNTLVVVTTLDGNTTCAITYCSSSMDPALHDHLRSIGVQKLGARLKIIADLPERTLGCLQEYLLARSGGSQQDDVHKPSSSLASSSNGSGLRRFVVCHSPCVFVRALPSANSEKLGSKIWGDDFLVHSDEHDDGWLKLAGEDGWVLRDGRRLGLGDLLRPLIPRAGALPASDLPPLAVYASDGLANRLRVVLSFAQIAVEHHRPLLVVWPKLNVCPGAWSDAFEPLPNVTFVEKAPDGVRPQFPPHSHDFHSEIKPRGEEACTRLYAMLTPTPEVRARVDETLSALRPSFLSLHIRRTDHCKWTRRLSSSNRQVAWTCCCMLTHTFGQFASTGGSNLTDEDFAAFAASHRALHAKVFLATDNAATQAKVSAAAISTGQAVVTAQDIVPDRSKLRQTSLEDAAVDIFTAAQADGPFMGTFSSSFSDTIMRLRKLGGVHGRTHRADRHEISDAHMQMKVTLHTPGGHLQHSPGEPMESHGDPLHSHKGG